MSKISDSELKVMSVVWDFEPCSAKFISVKLEEQIGWNINTTYTTIKGCIKKGFLKRTDPNFICTSLISRDIVALNKAEDLVNKLYNGSTELLFASMIENKKLTSSQIKRLRELIEKLE